MMDILLFVGPFSFDYGYSFICGLDDGNRSDTEKHLCIK